jgi:pyruvate kinase
MNTLSLLWGVRGYYYDSFASTDDTMSEIKNIIKAKGIIQKDDLVVNIASMPITEKGMTNMLKLSSVD